MKTLLSERHYFLALAFLTFFSRFRKKLLRNDVKVFAEDFSAMLYPENGYDPDDPENGLLRSTILVRVRTIYYLYRSI